MKPYASRKARYVFSLSETVRNQAAVVDGRNCSAQKAAACAAHHFLRWLPEVNCKTAEKTADKLPLSGNRRVMSADRRKKSGGNFRGTANGRKETGGERKEPGKKSEGSGSEQQEIGGTNLSIGNKRKKSASEKGISCKEKKEMGNRGKE